MDNYTCKTCNYNTNIKCNYNKHLKTKNHRKLSGEIIIKETKTHYCEYCDKIYSSRQSLYLHKKKTCKKKKTDEEVIKLKKENEKLKQLICELSKNKGKNDNIKLNDDTDTNNYKHINCYTETDFSQIKYEDFFNILSNHSYDCMFKLLELIHINSNKSENMNIIVSNLKDNYMKILCNGDWIAINTKEQLEIIYIKLLSILNSLFEKYKNKLSLCDNAKYKIMIEHIETNKEQIKKKMKELLYNKRKIIIENKKKHKLANK